MRAPAGLPRFGRLAVIQPRPGIGDMVWHLPHLRALARHADAPVVLVTRPRSHADQLVGSADGYDRILMIERGPWSLGGRRHEGARGAARLVADLRALGCDGAVLLTRSRSLAWATLAAGIGRRHGYGYAGTHVTLRPPFLPAATIRGHPYWQATEWLALAGIPLDDPEPTIPVDPVRRDRARDWLGATTEPPVAVGIAGSDAWKCWPTARFRDLVSGLARARSATFVLVGGPAERAAADAVARDLAGRAVVRPALGLDLRDLAALLSLCRCYVGNDTAALNLAAAVGVRTYGLFGATPVLRHSRYIVPIVPPGGPSEVDGMARLTVDQVLRTMADDA